MFSQLIVIAITIIAITIIAISIIAITISIIVKSPGKTIIEILLCPLQGATIPVVNCPLIAILPFLSSFFIIVKTVIQEKRRKETWQEYSENIRGLKGERGENQINMRRSKLQYANNALLVKKVQREGGEWCPMRICDRNENFAKIRTKEYRGENYISRICLESCQLRIKNLAN